MFWAAFENGQLQGGYRHWELYINPNSLLDLRQDRWLDAVCMEAMSQGYWICLLFISHYSVKMDVDTPILSTQKNSKK